MASKVTVYTSTGCPKCKQVKEQLAAWGVAFEERNVTDSQEHFKALQERKIFGTPATIIADRFVLGFQPEKLEKRLRDSGISIDMSQTGDASSAEAASSNPAAERDADAHSESIFSDWDHAYSEKTFDFVVIGGGPAGASAAVYAARAKLDTLVVDKAPAAGTLATTHKIANYPGVRKEVSGIELLQEMQLQAKDFGASFLRAQVLGVDFSDPDVKKIETPSGTIQAKTVFIGVGAKAPSSKIKGEEKLAGHGVSYCSTCDAAFYEGQTVAVTGSTEEAVHEATVLARFCKEVHFLLPTEQMKGEDYLQRLKEYDNIKLYTKHRIKEIAGDEHVEGITVQDDKRKLHTWQVDGVFLYLAGMKPGTDFLGDAVKRDSEGYIEVNERLETNVKGVYAGGDARRTLVKQAVISAADGCMAALGAESLVKKRDKPLPQYN